MKKKKVYLLAAMGIFILILFLILEGLIRFGGRTDAAAQADYLVVLGCSLDGAEPGECLRERLKAAEAYLKENPQTVAVLSGGQGRNEDITEAAAMYSALARAGIAPGRLLLEEGSHSTYQNLIYSEEIIKTHSSADKPKIVLVTNDFHVFRAKSMASYLGWDVTAVAADTPLRLAFVNHLREYASILFWGLKRIGIFPMG